MSKNGHSPFDVEAAVLARLQIQPTGNDATTVPVRRTSQRNTPQIAAIASFLHAPML
jgi:hypothetical protein